MVREISLYLADEPFGIWEQTEHELGRAGLPPPFWAFAWAGGQALARYLLDHPAEVAGRAVLDVAAGCGLVAIAAARAGARSVTATEVDRFAAAAIGLNAQVNDTRLTVTLADVLDGDGAGADVVLAGDVWYEKSMASRFLEFLRRASAGGREVLVGDPGRAYLPRSSLEPVACYDVLVPRALEDADIKPTTVWRLAAGTAPRAAR